MMKKTTSRSKGKAPANKRKATRAKRKPKHPQLTAKIICPAKRGQEPWADLLSYDDDMYVAHVGPTIAKRLEDIIGWSADSVEDLCRDLRITYEEEWIKVPLP